MSHNINNNNKFNKKSTYDFQRNNIKINMKKNNLGYNNYNNDINKNELNNEKEFINISKEYNNNERYDDLFNKEEYNKLYKKGQGIANQIKKNLKIKYNNDNSINDLDEKIKYQLSTIKNDKFEMHNDFDNINDIDLGQEIENDKINDNNNENKDRPFSPPITKIEDGENKDFFD